jgi:hypothetical protein
MSQKKEIVGVLDLNQKKSSITTSQLDLYQLLKKVQVENILA